MGSLSWWHWLIIIAAFILIFGARKLPDAARGVGRSLRILKSEVSAMQEENPKNQAAEETDESAQSATPHSEITASPKPAASPDGAPATQSATAPAATAPAATAPAATAPATAPAAESATAPTTQPAAQAATQQSAGNAAEGAPVINGVPVSENKAD